MRQMEQLVYTWGAAAFIRSDLCDPAPCSELRPCVPTTVSFPRPRRRWGGAGARRDDCGERAAGWGDVAGRGGMDGGHVLPRRSHGALLGGVHAVDVRQSAATPEGRHRARQAPWGPVVTGRVTEHAWCPHVYNPVPSAVTIESVNLLLLRIFFIGVVGCVRELSGVNLTTRLIRQSG